MTSHYSNPAIEAAWQRCVQDAKEGVVREWVSAFRLEAEMHVLAEKKGLVPPTPKKMFAEHLRAKGITRQAFLELSGREKLELIREAFAD